MVAIKALELKNEVITTPFSFIATSSSIKMEWFGSCIFDIDESLGNMISESVEKNINSKTSDFSSP